MNIFSTDVRLKWYCNTVLLLIGLCINFAAYSIDISITGTVSEIDNNGKKVGIPGAAIREKGTKNGVTANTNGEV